MSRQAGSKQRRYNTAQPSTRSTPETSTENAALKQATAIVFKGVNQIELALVSLPALKDHEVLVETAITGISQGTDRAMVAGTYGGVHDRYPFIYGYLRVGVVVETGAGVARVSPGDRVFAGLSGCRLDPDDGYGPVGGAYTSHGVVHESDLVRLPNFVSNDLAALSGLGAIAYQGVAASRLRPRQRVLVVGLGAIGQFSAMFSAFTGAEVAGADTIASRRQLASQLFGIDTFDPAARPLVDAVPGWEPSSARPWAGRNGPPTSAYEQLRWQQASGPLDAVIDTTGKAELVGGYIDLLAREGTLCLQGYYGGEVAFDHHRAHMKRLSFHCPGGMDLADYETVLNLVRKRPDLAQLVQHRIPVERAPEDLRYLLDNPSEAVGAVIDWN
jgi:2-desacetyl-2-hydroxyethyl bacteriochlorophyllide A dehydrogenase